MWGAGRRYREEFEADMSLGLLVLAIDIDAGTELRKALERISAGGYGHFSSDVEKALREAAGGASLPQCLESIGKRTGPNESGLKGDGSNGIGSIYVKRAVIAMKNAYRTGEGRALRMIAEEMLERNENRLREYSSKSGLLSQAATVFTVVLPTLVVCLVMIAAVISAPKIPPPALSLLIGFGFSLFAAALYQYQLRSVPVFIKRLYRAEKIGIGSLKEKVGLLGDEKYFWHVFLASGGLAVLALAMFTLSFGLLIGIVSGIVCGVLCAGIGAAYPFFVFEGARRDMEDELPLVLEQAAQFADLRGEAVLRIMGELEYGILSKKFSSACQEIRAGGTLRPALMKIAEDAQSGLLRQALELIARSYERGVDMREAFRETAMYIQRVKFIFQESRAATFGERATQLFGFLISAFLFGIVVSMGRGLGALLSGGFFDVEAGVMEAVVIGIRINLLVQPFVISLSVANLEGDMKRFFIYLPILLAAGNLLFFLAGRVNLL